MAPNASPVSTPRGAAAEASAIRSAISGMPQGAWVNATNVSSVSAGGGAGGGGFTKTQDRQRNADMLNMMSFNGSGIPMAGSLDDTAPPVYETYDAASKLHVSHTLSSQNRVKGNKSAIAAGRDGRPASASLAHNSSTRRSHSAMGHQSHNRSTKLLDGSVHTADAACCGYRNLEAHQAHHKKVKGLYVTFCQNSMESQLANATRQLACETESRLVEEDYHRQKLAALVHENDRLKAQHAEWKEKVEKWEEEAAKKNHQHIVLKDEYEKRWREEVELSAQLRLSTNEAVTEAERLKTIDGGNRYRIQELENEVEAVKATLKRAEDQARDNAKRAQGIFDEKELLRRKAEDQENFIKQLEEKLRTKEAVVVGLEKELGKANDKLSSVAFFRESFSSGKKGKGKPSGIAARSASLSGSMRASSPSGGSSATKDKLYQRYFGRMG